MNKRFIFLKLLATAVVIAGVPSCNMLHNKNDWAMAKGSSPKYTPKQIGKFDGSVPLRGGN